ncbi:hypothetical protein V6U79_25650 [Micromonospora sp. CPCC 205556]
MTFAPRAWSAFTAAAQVAHSPTSRGCRGDRHVRQAAGPVRVWRFRRSQEHTWAAIRRRSPASRPSSTRRPGIGSADGTGWPR